MSQYYIRWIATAHTQTQTHKDTRTGTHKNTQACMHMHKIVVYICFECAWSPFQFQLQKTLLPAGQATQRPVVHMVQRFMVKVHLPVL